MEKTVKSISRGVRISPKKARDVARVLVGKPANYALEMLKFIPRKSARVLYKTLKSAIANAENNHNLSSAGLFVAEAHVDDGLIMKRFDPRARGSAHPIRRRTAHIRIQLSDKAPAPKKTKKSTNKVAKKEESK